MTIDEIIEKTLGKRFYEETDIDEIISYLKTCTKKVTIKETGIEIGEILKEVKEGVKLDLSIKCENNTIIIPYGFKKLKEKILSNIPSSVTELSIPNSFMDSIREFYRLNDLNKLTINSFGFPNEEDLEEIKENTNIKQIDYKSVFLSLIEEFKDLVMIEKDSRSFGYYKDIVLRQNNEEKDETKNEEITIYAGNITKDDLEKIYSLINEDLSKTNRKITIKGKDKKYSLTFIDGIVNISIEDENLNIANDFYEFFESKGIKVNSIFLNLIINYKKSVNYIDQNYEKLDKLNQKVEIRVRQNGLDASNWEDFRSLTETMKWYRNIIKDYPLSPVEKLAFAYDILKTFEYNETKNNDTMESREPYKIIKTGHIVCAGYTAMLEEIFKDFDENIKIGSFGVTCYDDNDKDIIGAHSRTIAIVDDKKYGIKGAYALDATWDSYKKEGTKKLDSEYTALDLYKYFMVPFSNYKKVFEHDSDIGFFKGDIEYLNTNLTEENINKEIASVNEEKESLKKKPLFNYEITDILKGKKEKEILELFKAQEIPFDKMMQIIRTVRIAEGYKEEELDREMEKVSKIYSRYYPQDSLTGKML